MDRDIDKVIALVRRRDPEVAVQQLQVRHPGADDDGLWFFTHPKSSDEVQLESSTGAVPFVVESNELPASDAHTVEVAVEEVIARLGLGARTA